MMPALPEGDGIGAQYPGDVGIENDPAVVFADGFEDIEDGAIAEGTERQKGKKWDSTFNRLVITRDPDNVHSGRQAVEITHTEPSNHNAVKQFGEGFDTVYVRYYMKYAKEFPGCHHTGMLILAGAPGVTLEMGSATGVVPDGRSHFVALLDTLPPRRDSGYPPPGNMNVYCYHMDQGRKWGDLFFPTGDVVPSENKWLFAEGFVPRPNLNAERGRWHCYELMVAANAPGRRDGRVAFWVDGKLRGDFGNLRFRDTEALKPNHVIICVHSSSTHPNKTLWYDDIVAATSYIGPQTRPAHG
ncbi:MAG: hypothetical protein AMK73_06735 [Planctomycetes bacterium SM23_32]|nr:MAG: hypothetical protein AMK73_06735 [Planctomycetes bacterium SM23_32]